MPQKDDILSELRRSRKETFLSLAARALDPKSDHAALMREWSLFADASIAKALESAMKGSSDSLRFSIIALGKLGSMELNFSSDVDLIYIYEGRFEEAAGVAARLTSILGDVTDDGFVFRVDLNLRPGGKDGGLVNTIDALERYYESTKDEWERQMLVRARFAAGDRTLASEFLKRVAPFVYRRSIDLAMLKKTRAIKLALEKSSSNEGWNNIKLGEGGIREIEFIVHSLQTIHGGKNPSLRVTNTFESLDRLLEHGIINQNKRDDLFDAYLLLRRCENNLQGKSDRAIHSLPKNGEGLKELSRDLGFASSEELLHRLDGLRKAVQRHFSALFESSYDKQEIREAMEANLETCSNEEEIIDSIPWFKNHITKKTQTLDLEGKITMNEVSERLTLLAEEVLDRSMSLVLSKLSPIYGTPGSSKLKRSEFAVLGLGKLGSAEMDYASDLDIIFIYSEDGETSGPKRISNHEFFTKFAQSILSIITLPTRYGKAYNVDTELRPSGRQGALVTSFEAFNRYHLREASLWERRALLRARVVAGDVTLGRSLSGFLVDAVYGRDLPMSARTEIDALRKKATDENRVKEGEIDLKKGMGSISDIEAVTHYLQLSHGRTNEKLRTQSTTAALLELKNLGMIEGDEFAELNGTYELFRKILGRARLFISHSTGTVIPKSEQFEAIAGSLGYAKGKDAEIDIGDKRAKIMDIYKRYLKG